MDKQALRNWYLKRRTALSPEALEEKSMAIANQCLKLPIWEKTYFHLFLTIESKQEVQTDFLLHILQGRDKSIVVPVADFKTGSLTSILLQENTPLKISSYGIPEPVRGIEIAPTTLEVVFVPLLAYDQQGNRLGYGKGFYDRFLASCHPDCLFVGLSFFEPEKALASNDWDVPMNYVVTPQNIHIF